jgi:hypothetical protein
LSFAASSDEVQLDDNGNNGSNQDVEETEEDAKDKKKENNEELNVEDHQKERTLEDCQCIRPFIDTHSMDRSEPLDDLQMFHAKDEDKGSQSDKGNINFENCSNKDVRKKDATTFFAAGQYLRERVNTCDDKANQICIIDNNDVFGHLCGDEGRCCKRVDESDASVHSHENITSVAELVSNSKCKTHNRKLKTSEWQESVSGNELIVVNCGDGGVCNILRQGHQEHLHLKWHLQQQVSPQDWICLCSLREYHYSI